MFHLNVSIRGILPLEINSHQERDKKESFHGCILSRIYHLQKLGWFLILYSIRMVSQVV